MKSIDQLFLQRSTSEKVFSLNQNITYKDLFNDALKIDFPQVNEGWLVIVDNKGPSILMIKIISCILQNQNFIISSSNDADSECLNKYQKWNNFNCHKQKKRNLLFHHIQCGILTSGTTGESKIIIHPIKNLFLSAKNVNDSLQVSNAENWNLVLPTYHIAGLSILFRCLINNCSFYEMNRKQLGTEPFTGFISIVAAQIPRLLSNKNLKPNKVKLFIGGGKTSKSLIQQCIKSGFTVYTSYGSSETASTFALKKHIDNQTLDSCGKPIFGNKAIIHSDVLAIKSQTLFEGTLKNDNITPPYLKMNFS
jgi:long-subunit acyl-CoA synthetase (AMP-forming)